MLYTTRIKTLIFFFGLVTIQFVYLSVSKVFAEEYSPQEEFSKAQVVEILDEGTREIDGFNGQYSHPFQKVSLKIIGEVDINKNIAVDYVGMSASSFQKVKVGQLVVVNQVEVADGLFNIRS